MQNGNTPVHFVWFPFEMIKDSRFIENGSLYMDEKKQMISSCKKRKLEVEAFKLPEGATTTNQPGGVRHNQKDKRKSFSPGNENEPI